jgi:hypothetical protein
MDKFNLNGKFNFEGMLKAQIDGKVSSWGYSLDCFGNIK